MIEKLELLRTICSWGGVICSILAVIFGFGYNYYGNKISSLRSEEENSNYEELRETTNRAERGNIPTVTIKSLDRNIKIDSTPERIENYIKTSNHLSNKKQNVYQTVLNFDIYHDVEIENLLLYIYDDRVFYIEKYLDGDLLPHGFHGWDVRSSKYRVVFQRKDSGSYKFVIYTMGKVESIESKIKFVWNGRVIR